jgi:hypothetical protein
MKTYQIISVMKADEFVRELNKMAESGWQLDKFSTHHVPPGQSGVLSTMTDTGHSRFVGVLVKERINEAAI